MATSSWAFLSWLSKPRYKAISWSVVPVLAGHSLFSVFTPSSKPRLPLGSPFGTVSTSCIYPVIACAAAAVAPQRLLAHLRPFETPAIPAPPQRAPVRIPGVKVTHAVTVIVNNLNPVTVGWVLNPDPHRVSFVGTRHVSSIGTYLWLMAHLLMSLFTWEAQESNLA